MLSATYGNLTLKIVPMGHSTGDLPPKFFFASFVEKYLIGIFLFYNDMHNFARNLFLKIIEFKKVIVLIFL